MVHKDDDDLIQIINIIQWSMNGIQLNSSKKDEIKFYVTHLYCFQKYIIKCRTTLYVILYAISIT